MMRIGTTYTVIPRREVYAEAKSSCPHCLGRGYEGVDPQTKVLRPTANMPCRREGPTCSVAGVGVDELCEPCLVRAERVETVTEAAAE